MNRLLCFLGGLALSAAASEPFVAWNFENWEPSRRVSVQKGFRLQGVPADKRGFNNSTGLESRKNISRVVSFPAADWKEFTFEVKFMLNPESKGKRSIIGCAMTTYNASQFMLRINPNNQLEAEFNLDYSGKKKHLTLASDPVKFVAGQYYTVRIASKSGGSIKIWLNGKLAAVKETGGFGISDIAIPKLPSGYPIFTIGFDLADPSVICRPLNGVVDDIKIWKTFEEPELTDQLATQASSGKQNDHLLISRQIKTSTDKFTVNDVPSESVGGLFGGFVRPDQKYLDAAAHAEMELTEDHLVVTFHCPVAKGTKINPSRKGVWGGDLVEFFFRPDPEKNEYFQYAANVNGESSSIRWFSLGTQDSKFRSGAAYSVKGNPEEWTARISIPRKEIGLERITPGQMANVNFTRTGPTGGGYSTWTPLGNSFHDIARFRKLVFGSRKKALFSELQKSRKELDSIDCPAVQKNKVSAELDKLAAMIEKKGDTAELFSALSNAIGQMQTQYTGLRFSNTPNLIWTPRLPWGNDIRVSPLSEKTKKISLVLPQNSYTYTSIIFSNLSDKPFLGQIKCFPPSRKQKGQIVRFNGRVWGERYEQSPVYKNVCFFEAIPLEMSAASIVYDPFKPLPMNTLIHASAKESKQLWLRFSSKGMKPGIYQYLLFLKPSYTGFQKQEIEISVDIRPVDCSTVKLDSGHYTDLYAAGGVRNAVRFLAKKGTNLLYMPVSSRNRDLFPEFDRQGNIRKFFSYSDFDKVIDESVSRGLAKEDIKLWLYFPLDGDFKSAGAEKCILPFNTPEWKKVLKAFLSDFTGHFEKKYGIGKDRIYFSLVDEPRGNINDPKSLMFKAYQRALLMKEADKDYRMMVNPDPRELKSFAQKKADLTKLISAYDVIELYRPCVTPEIVKWAKESGKAIWTYGIYDKSTSPDVYRREYWQSFRDGFTEIITYWHLESQAGYDGFDSQDGGQSRVDYGTIFADFNLGTVLTGRRQEAHDLGREDFRILKYCRQLLAKKKVPSALKAKFDTIVRKAAEGDMADMEDARLRILKIAEELQK